MLLFVPALLFCFAVVTALWFYGERIRNASIIDAAWPVLVSLPAWFYAATGAGWVPRKILMLALASLWGGRLSLHIFHRLRHEKKEDPRYTRLREKWGSRQSQEMLRFFWIQGAAAAFFSIPFLIISANESAGFHPAEIAGFLLALTALYGESLADTQLAAFKKNPANRGKTCRAGLWNLSRHPNYFFEWLFWAALFIFSLNSPYGVLTFIFPAAIFHVLRNVTGVPLAEKQAIASRGEDYRKYQREVNAFFPGFPRTG